jgi:hypothetical protein
VNEGRIYGKIKIHHSDTTIENGISGKIESSGINWGNGAFITLINNGEITATGIININKYFINSGTLIQTINNKSNLKIGDKKGPSHKMINSGYMRIKHYESFYELINTVSGRMVITSDVFFHRAVINEGTIESVGLKTKYPYIYNKYLFEEDVTNTGTIITSGKNCRIQF